MSELITIGEVSRRSGVAASALRYYEDRGLIESERAGSGHRRYTRAVLRRIAFIVLRCPSSGRLPSCLRAPARSLIPIWFTISAKLWTMDKFTSKPLAHEIG